MSAIMTARPTKPAGHRALECLHFARVTSFVYDSEDHIARLREFLHYSDLAARERAESREIFQSAGGVPVEEFHTIDFTKVRMITFEGLCIRLLLTTGSEAVFEFSSHKQLERTLGAWSLSRSDRGTTSD